MNFGQAIEALNQGKMIQRTSWNDKDLFVFKQAVSSIRKDIIPNMQLLPQLVKDEFEKRTNYNFIYYANQLALVDKTNLITGWSPSPSDALAEDWVIYN